MTDQIIEMIEKSELWKNLNASVKALYVAEGREPSQEEYQALRNILIMKVIKETPEIMEIMSAETYRHFTQQ